MTEQRVVEVAVQRIARTTGSHDRDLLAVEEPLEIRLEYGPRRARTRRSITVTMRTPGSDVELLHPQNLRFRLLYFSMTTLTTVSFGDITPLNPVARSLAALESVIGQLFPPLLLARLVSVELHYRQQRGH